MDAASLKAKRREWKRRYKEKLSLDPERQARLKVAVRAYSAKNREKISAGQHRRWLAQRDHMHAVSKAYKAANPERVVAWRKNFKERRPSRVRLFSCRKTAKDKGLDFDLDEQWFAERLHAGVCEATGLPFDMRGGRRPLSPSVDRINPKGGYTKANCRMIVWWLNRALSNTGEEFAVMIFQRLIERRYLDAAA